MTDELDDLKAALTRATPAPDGKARARALAQAMENFDRLKERPLGLRSKADPPVKAGFLAGVFSMLKSLKSRPLLAASTSAAALIAGFVVFLPIAGTGAAYAVKPAAPEVAREITVEGAAAGKAETPPIAPKRHPPPRARGQTAAQPEADTTLAPQA